jgi:hypothetical protein
MTDTFPQDLQTALAERANALPSADVDDWLIQFDRSSRARRRSARLRAATNAGGTTALVGLAVLIFMLSVGSRSNHQQPRLTNPAVPAAYEGWTPIPTKAAAARAKSAATRCEYFAVHKSHLGEPLITDARGPYVAVLFVDRRDNYERSCIYGPNLGLQGGGWIKSPIPLEAPPSANSIQHFRESGSCNPATGRAVEEMHGQAGSHVVGATFYFPNRAAVQATIRRGFYMVWWPWPLSPTHIIIRTKSGETNNILMRGRRRWWC